MQLVSVTQKDGVGCPGVLNRGIHKLLCSMNVFMRFPAHRSVEEGTEDLPCKLGVWKRMMFCNPAD